MAGLDEGLATLHRKERNGDALPIPLRRFRDHVGLSTTIEAMQHTVSELLRKYATHGSDPSPRISASTLCKACGIALEGRFPARDRTRTAYSLGGNFTSASSHSGTLYLDPERPRIRLADGLDYKRARVAVAHELGHYLIHRRGDSVDSFTAKLPSSAEEEALSEYAARLLLIPDSIANNVGAASNLVEHCLQVAQRADVTVHSAAARLGDPDSSQEKGLRGIILWRLNSAVPHDDPISARLTPQWHLCPDVFVPIRRCHAGRNSLIAEVAASDESTARGSRRERVRIGSLVGTFRVDAIAWGNLKRGSRLVLAAFVEE
jgi:hypothetical protein